MQPIKIMIGPPTTMRKTLKLAIFQGFPVEPELHDKVNETS